jgi:ABC-type branched-subunit amino acid transport system substrate-binding protein
MWPGAAIPTVIDMTTPSIDGPAAAVQDASTRRKASERHRVARAGAAAIAMLGLIIAACGSPPANTASAPGITPTNVLIGSDQPLTGPAATGYSEIGPASKSFFAHVNAHGGVNGRTITYTYLDDVYDAAGSARAVPDEQQLVSDDHVFAYFNGFGLLTHQAVVDSLNAHGVPDLFVGSSCDCWNEPRQHPETFGFGTNYALEGRLMGSYVARTFPADRIAYIYETNPIGCCQQAVSEMEKNIPPSHVVAREPYTGADLVPPVVLLPQLQAARAAGAQVLVVDTLAPQAIAEVLLGEAVLGYHPPILDPFPLSADPTTVGSFIEQFSRGKASPAIENGLITQAHLPSASDDGNAWIRLFRQVHDQYEPNEPFDNMTVYGMAAAALFVQALRQAGPNPTRSSIVSAINGGAVNAGGPGLVSLGYSARNHDGYPGAQIGSIQNGSLVLSGPAYVAGPAGAITAHALVSSSPRIG